MSYRYEPFFQPRAKAVEVYFNDGTGTRYACQSEKGRKPEDVNIEFRDAVKNSRAMFLYLNDGIGDPKKLIATIRTASKSILNKRVPA